MGDLLTELVLRSPVPGNYFGHYEQFFRQRLTDHGGDVRMSGDSDTGDTSSGYMSQDIYRRWMSDTDISSDCLDNASTR